METIQRLIGVQLKLIRQRQKLTQEQLAEKTGIDGVSKSRISDIERGRINISLKTLDMLLKTLEIPLTQLFDFEDVINSPELAEKHLMIEALSSALKDRSALEVKHVLDSAKNFIEVIDYKMKYNL